MAEMTLSPGWATYLRVSDEDKQTPERSFAMQRRRIRERLLTPSQLSHYREYRDKLTGTSAKRADYQQLLKDAEEGHFSHLGLYRADRFGRDTVEGLQAATKLMGMGVKIRVAHMPGLEPETPDGFFMFLLQMGMAQREVDVLRQRTRDGTEAKLRAGGWSNRAPEGYVNKEEQIGSGKYRRWVESDSEFSQPLREAWDLLLTGNCTLDQICEELTSRGYLRSNGRPWAWTRIESGRRKTAKNRLHEIFHNPFYAGWVVSERFQIALGEVRGRWEPLVTLDEFERGVEILRRHDKDKSRPRRHVYLLRGVLWVQILRRDYKLYGSTPSGRSSSYSYYITHAKPNGRKFRLQCDIVDKQIPLWLEGVTIDHELQPAIREIYRDEIGDATGNDLEKRKRVIEQHLGELRNEETRLARLFITEKITEESYVQLRAEWQEKVRYAEADLANLEREVARYVNDLDMALVLMTQLSRLYARMDERQRVALLQILAKRIIVNTDGEIIDHELNSPFAYLKDLKGDLEKLECGRGSEQVRSRRQRYYKRPTPSTGPGVFLLVITAACAFRG